MNRAKQNTEGEEVRRITRAKEIINDNLDIINEANMKERMLLEKKLKKKLMKEGKLNSSLTGNLVKSNKKVRRPGGESLRG